MSGTANVSMTDQLTSTPLALTLVTMTGRGMDGSVVSTIQQGFPTTALAMMKFVNMSHVWHQLITCQKYAITGRFDC